MDTDGHRWTPRARRPSVAISVHLCPGLARAEHAGQHRRGMAARARIKTTPTPRPVVRAPAPAQAPVIEPGPGTWKVAIALFLLLFAIYLLNFRQRGAGDSIPTRRLPFSLLREGNLNLDEFTWERNE